MTTQASPWWQYVEEGLERNGITQSFLADTIGLNRGAASQWRNGGSPGPIRDRETIRATAQALGTSVLDALVAAGYVTPEELEAERAGVPLVERTDQELLEELLRRAQRRTNTPAPARRAAKTTAVTRKATQTRRRKQ